MKNNNWYPWVVVGLLWVVALLNYMDKCSPPCKKQ